MYMYVCTLHFSFTSIRSIQNQPPLHDAVLIRVDASVTSSKISIVLQSSLHIVRVQCKVLFVYLLCTYFSPPAASSRMVSEYKTKLQIAETELARAEAQVCTVYMHVLCN